MRILTPGSFIKGLGLIGLIRLLGFRVEGRVWGSGFREGFGFRGTWGLIQTGQRTNSDCQKYRKES